MTKSEVTKYINSLKGYRGYVQFSHRSIETNKDVFTDKDPKVEDEKGFVYEAHFANGSQSITIRQINNDYAVSKTDISKVKEEDMQSFLTVCKQSIKMAQIWEDVKDKYCNGFETKKLKAVVFAGFEKGVNS